MPKKEVLKNTSEDSINYKKLFFELMAVLAVVFVVTLIVLYPFLKDKGAFDRDKYAEYRPIIEEVDNYDYSKGRSLELEERLDKGYEQTTSDNEAYFYALASGIYYCNIGYYNTAIEAFNWLEGNALDDEKETLEAEKRRVFCERKMAKEAE